MSWLLDFNGISTYLGLFHGNNLGKRVHRTFIFLFICVFVFVFFCTRFYQMQMILKQIYLTHRSDPKKYPGYTVTRENWQRKSSSHSLDLISSDAVAVSYLQVVQSAYSKPSQQCKESIWKHQSFYATATIVTETFKI